MDTSGHRERLKKRFRKSGLDGFLDYEVLELLLTYVIPRKDTKPVARELISKFKSLQGVLSKSTEELKQVSGIGEQSALFLSILNQFIAFYYDHKSEPRQLQFNTIDQLVEYFNATIGSKPNEVLRAVYLNNMNGLIDAENIGEGTVTEVVAYPRRIVEGALRSKASSVIIAHNHPEGLPRPSRSDDILTQKIKLALDTVNIPLQEHLIIASEGYYSYKKIGFFG